MHLETEPQEHHVPFTLFFAAVAVQLALAIGIFMWAAPHVFAAESAHPLKVVGWTILIGLPLSLFEYFYHRYLLHSAILPFLASMHRAHSTHHGLTAVKAPVTPKEPEKFVEVKSEFPVEEPHQEESMMFPLYALGIFYLLFLIVYALPLKLIFPREPVIFGVILSVTAYYSSYEIWHAILHLPFDRFWKPALENRATKTVVGRMYGFHLMHHWRPTSNLAIVGFWGIALWDHVFRTHRRPENMPLDGAEVNFHDSVLPKPLWPIRLLDKWQAGLYKSSRAIERFLARVFLGRQTR